MTFNCTRRAGKRLLRCLALLVLGFVLVVFVVQNWASAQEFGGDLVGGRVLGPRPVAAEGGISIGPGPLDDGELLGASVGRAYFGHVSVGWGQFGYRGPYGYYGGYWPRAYYGGYYGGWYRPWGYGPYGGYYGGWLNGGWLYGPPVRFQPAPVVLPPAVIGADQIFGAAPAMRMLGVAPAQALPAAVVPLRPEAVGRVDALPAREEKAAFVSNAAARQRASKFMELGDSYFAQGNFALAYDRYTSAVQAAPDIVETYLRRGQSLIAAQNYKLATETYKFVFKLHPAWSRTKFRLDDLYGKRVWEKEEHIDNLASAAEQNPTAELMFLLGAQLLYDNQPERALRFFDRAKELHQAEPLPIPAPGDLKVDAGKADAGKNEPPRVEAKKVDAKPAPNRGEPKAKPRDRELF